MSRGIYKHSSHCGFQKDNQLGKLQIGRKRTIEQKKTISDAHKGQIRRRR